jgi:hypothetical protein
MKNDDAIEPQDREEVAHLVLGDIGLSETAGGLGFGGGGGGGLLSVGHGEEMEVVRRKGECDSFAGTDWPRQGINVDFLIGNGQ